MEWTRKLKNFIIEYKKVLKVTKKPTGHEFKNILKITGLGVLVIGFMGFVIQMVKILIFQ